MKLSGWTIEWPKASRDVKHTKWGRDLRRAVPARDGGSGVSTRALASYLNNEKSSFQIVSTHSSVINSSRLSHHPFTKPICCISEI